MKYCYLVFGFLFFSCAPENLPEHEQDKNTEQAWVCHNPESPQHGELCEEAIHPLRGRHETCHWVTTGAHTGKGRRIKNSFCWLIEKADCVGNLEYEWQRENCHFFD